MNKGQRDNRGAAQNHSKPDRNKAGRNQEIKCGNCDTGHLTIKCFKDPNRLQANNAKIGNNAKGVNFDAKGEAQGAQLRTDNYQNKGPGDCHGRGKCLPMVVVGKVNKREFG